MTPSTFVLLASCASLIPASASAQTLLGPGGLFIPSEPSCSQRLAQGCLPRASAEATRAAAAKSAYLVQAIGRGDGKWETVHRINAMLHAQRLRDPTDKDLTKAANAASSELKALQARASGDYKISHLQRQADILVDAIPVKDGRSLVAKSGAAILADISVDYINSAYNDYSQPDRQYELFRQREATERDAHEALTTALAAASRDKEFARALDYELQAFGVNSAQDVEATRKAVMKRNPELLLPDLREVMKLDKADLEKKLDEGLKASGQATVAALKQEFAARDAAAADKAREEARAAEQRLKRETAVAAAEGTYLLAVQVLGMSDPKAAARVQLIGDAAFKVYGTVERFSNAINSADKMTSGLGAAAMTGNIVGIGLALASSFMKQGPDSTTLILEQLKAMQEQLKDIQFAVNQGFLNTDLRLESMTKIMVSNFEDLHRQVRAGQVNQQALYDRSTQILGAVSVLDKKLDRHFREAVDILGAPNPNCYNPGFYRDVQQYQSVLGQLFNSCLGSSINMVEKQPLSTAIRGMAPDPTRLSAAEIVKGMNFGPSHSRIPDYSLMQVGDLQALGVSKGLVGMPVMSMGVPEPAAWMSYSRQFIAISYAFEPIRSQLGVRPIFYTQRVVASAAPLAAFYRALAPSDASRTFYLALLADIGQAHDALAASVLSARRYYEGTAFAGWSFEELEWLAAGADPAKQPANLALKFSPNLRSEAATATMIQLDPCTDSVAQSKLTISNANLPTINPLHVVMEQADKRKINYCYSAQYTDPQGSSRYNDKQDYVWFYKNAFLSIDIRARNDNGTIATRNWKTEGRIRYSETERQRLAIPKGPGGAGKFWPLDWLPSQAGLDHWIANQTYLPGERLGNIIGSNDRRPGVMDEGMSMLAGYVTTDLSAKLKSMSETEGEVTADVARKAIPSLVTLHGSMFGERVYAQLLGGEPGTNVTAITIPPDQQKLLSEAADQLYRTRSALGAYLQLGTVDLFEGNQDLISLFYGDHNRRLYDPFTFGQLWHHGRLPGETVPGFETRIAADARVRAAKAQTLIASIGQPGGPGYLPPGTPVAYNAPFQTVLNDLTLVAALQER
jgi:hypothetical protein